MMRPTILSALFACSLTSVLLVPAAGLARDGAQDPVVVPARPEPQEPAPPDNLTPPTDAETTASGLAYKVLEEGTGANRPDGNDLAVVHYTGWSAADGSVFDSSVARGQAQLLPLEALIDGWTEGLQLMTEGAKWRLWIPGELAYQGIEGRPQGMLVFDVELLEVRRIPPVPEHLGDPPADAELAQSGLAWEVLQEGTGEESPGPGDTVEVHYIGWNPEGQWFEATYAQGRTATLAFDALIEGWKEALSDMVPGEERRLWVPDRLAYDGQSGKPEGPLTFDLKLVSINPEG